MPIVRLTRGDLDGLALHYVEAGAPGPGPAMVLIHGLGSFAESWRYVLAGLAPYGRVIALDLPGFGQSSKPRRAYRLDFLVAAVAEALAALDVDRAHLVGHSLGGGVAAALASAHPDLVDRLALVAAAVPGFDLHLSWAMRMIAWPGVGELLGALVTPRLATSALERCFYAPAPDEVAFFVEHGFAERACGEARAAYLATLRGATLDFTTDAARHRDGLARFPRPVLVVHGLQDRVVPPEHAGLVLDGLPGAEARWLDRCGHFPQIEHAATVNGWLREFLHAAPGVHPTS